MTARSDRRYAPTHEWHKTDGDLIIIGISQFAVEELTDITYLEVLRTEGQIKAGESFGEIESVKATSELYSGIDGNIVAVNQDVIDNPALLNEDPWDKGWLIKVKPADATQVEALMDAEQYAQHVKS